MNPRPSTSSTTTQTTGSLILAVALGLAAVAAIPGRTSAAQLDRSPASIVAAQACATPYTAPKARAGFATEMPAIAAGQGVDSGESIVEVTLSAKGDLVNATIEKSSGNRWLDAAALRNARSTLFIPATTNCEPVGGTYLYVVDF